MRNTRRAKDGFYAGRFENGAEALAVFGVAIDDQVRLAQGEAIYRIHELASSLLHPFGVGRQRRTAHVDRA